MLYFKDKFADKYAKEKKCFKVITVIMQLNIEVLPMIYLI